VTNNELDQAAEILWPTTEKFNPSNDVYQAIDLARKFDHFCVGRWRGQYICMIGHKGQHYWDTSVNDAAEALTKTVLKAKGIDTAKPLDVASVEAIATAEVVSLD
jgi:hypothetical protein